jgi:hypothetical protein
MQKRLAQRHALIAMTAFAFVLSMSVDETSAQNAPLKNSITGTFDCLCTNNSGTCELIQQGPTLTCTKGNGTCTAGCELSTTTTGVASGVRSLPPPNTGGLVPGR